MFLRNALMSLAISLVPRVLRPIQCNDEGMIACIPGENPFDGRKADLTGLDESMTWPMWYTLNEDTIERKNPMAMYLSAYSENKSNQQ